MNTEIQQIYRYIVKILIQVFYLYIIFFNMFYNIFFFHIILIPFFIF